MYEYREVAFLQHLVVMIVMVVVKKEKNQEND